MYVILHGAWSTAVQCIFLGAGFEQDDSFTFHPHASTVDVSSKLLEERFVSKRVGNGDRWHRTTVLLSIGTHSPRDQQDPPTN
jgi:hypothetical protein